MVERNQSLSSFIQIGTIHHARGLKGEVAINDHLGAITEKYKYVFLCDSLSQDPEKYEVDNIRFFNSANILKLKGIDSREKAEAIEKKIVLVQKEQIKIDLKKQYIWGDLVQRQVMTSDQKPLGVIELVYNCGASDIVRIKSADGKRILDIPFVGDYFDLDFARDDSPIKVVHPFVYFDGMWQ